MKVDKISARSNASQPQSPDDAGTSLNIPPTQTTFQRLLTGGWLPVKEAKKNTPAFPLCFRSIPSPNSLLHYPRTVYHT